MAHYEHHSKYFYGNKVSDYGLEHGYVDYRTLAKAFEAVLNNDIIQKTWDVIGYWKQESGYVDNSEEINELQEQIEELMLDNENDEHTEEIEELQDKINGLEEEQEDSYNAEIFQYFIVSDRGAEILKEYNEIVFYNEELDMYVWGVTHWGTSWDYVLTDIKIVEDTEE